MASFTNPIPQKGSNMKHTIVLFLSTFATTPTPNDDDNLIHTKYKNIEESSVDPENPEVDCVQPNESAVRFLQAKLAKQTESIDKLYIIASKGVKKEADFFYNGKEMCVSHVELFKKRLENTIGFVCERRDFQVHDAYGRTRIRFITNIYGSRVNIKVENYSLVLR